MLGERRRWFLLAMGWIALLILGFGGFVQQANEGGFDRSTLDNVYLTALLAVLDFDAPYEALNWRLEVARFAVPLMAAGTLLQTASVVFRDQFALIRARRRRNHTIVCGLGDMGTRLASSLAAEGEAVVAIESEPAAPGIAAVQQHKIPVVPGDATDLALLKAVRLDRAKRLIAVCGSDGVNIDVAAAARQLPRAGHRPALRVSAHLGDAELCGLLAGSDVGGAGGARIDYFNLPERSARAWLAAHPPFGDGTRPPHLVIAGVSALGRSLVVAAAQRWRDTGEGPLPITLVDPIASGRWHALRLQHPALPDACDVTTLDLDLEAPDAETVDRFEETLTARAPTAVAVAYKDEAAALSAGLLIRQLVRDERVPVVVRTSGSGGLAQLVGGDRFGGLQVFPMLERACTREVVEGGVREQLAQAIHEDYVARAGAGAGDAFRRPWQDLDDAERESSRRAADGILAGLATISCEIVPMRSWGAPQFDLSDDDVDALAALEHERWRDERAADGWTYGPARDDAARTNPLLVPWDELPDDARRWNLDTARALPATLARAGLEPIRRYSIVS